MLSVFSDNSRISTTAYKIKDSQLERERSQNKFLCCITFNPIQWSLLLFYNFQGELFKYRQLVIYTRCANDF